MMKEQNSMFIIVLGDVDFYSLSGINFLKNALIFGKS